MFFYYKGFSFIPEENELVVIKDGVVIVRHPINAVIMNMYDIKDVIEEVLEM